MTRPYPPAELVADPFPRFAPAPELEQWARQQFINELSPIHNEEHIHLLERCGLPRITIYDRPLRSKAGRRKRAGRAVAIRPTQIGLPL